MAANTVRAVVSSASSRRAHRAASGASYYSGNSSVSSSSLDGSILRDAVFPPSPDPSRILSYNGSGNRRLPPPLADSISDYSEEDLLEDDEVPLVEENDNSNSISGRQWMVLTILMFVTMTSSFAVCLFPPFFPRIAEEKGSSATIYGFIIGTNCLTSFIVTPFIGKHLKVIGVRFALISGMLSGGFCCILSGFLEFTPPGISFVVVAVCIRVVHAIGNAFVILATFTFTAMEFPNRIGKIFSLTRTAMNLAQLFGPVVGGAIYMSGGFFMPFVAMGTLQIFFSIISIPVMPDIRDSHELVDNSYSKNKNKKTITISNMLKIPTIWFSFVTFVVATMCNGFLSINLEPQVLRVFELSPVYVGVLFGLKDGANSVASPIWGLLCDKSRKTSVKPYMILSSILVGVSFFLMGSSAVIGIDLKLTMPLLIMALVLNGIGIGGEQVAGVIDALHEAVNAGYPDDPSMHGIIAGLWSSFSGAGRFISRAGSGMLVDYIGFNYTAAVVTLLQTIIGSITFFYMICYECHLKSTVHWNEAENNEIFTETNSPSESLMAKTVYINVPSNNRHVNPRSANSLPPARVSTLSPSRRARRRSCRRMSVYDEDEVGRLSCSVASHFD